MTTSSPAADRPAPLVVVPAAGLGTRLFPASLAVPKELLPLGVQPAIVACLLEAAAAGADELAIVLSPGKDAIRRFLDPATWPAVAREGAETASLRGLLQRLRLTFADQPEPDGVRDAVERGQRRAGGRLSDDACAVLYPDLLHLPDQRGLATLLGAHQRCDPAAAIFAVHDAGRPGARHGSAARVELDGDAPPGVPVPIRRVHAASSAGAPAAPGELRTTFGEVQGAALGRLLDQEGRGPRGTIDDGRYLDLLNRLAQQGLLYGTRLPGEVLDLGTAAGYRDAARRFGGGELSLREDLS